MPENSASERALRAVAIGRKNWLFAGSDAGGVRAAHLYSLIASCKRHGDRALRLSPRPLQASPQPFGPSASRARAGRMGDRRCASLLIQRPSPSPNRRTLGSWENGYP
jgi:hypothetical protein